MKKVMRKMLEQVLTHIHNWFPVDGGKHSGTFEIASGELDVDFIRPGQYYRIRGSVFNDGLHKYMPNLKARAGDDEAEGDGEETPEDPLTLLQDETFTGEVWALAIPLAVQTLAEEIAEWHEKNPETDKMSESFGGYSYTRGASSASGSALSGWQAAFAARLSPYRRPYDD